MRAGSAVSAVRTSRSVALLGTLLFGTISLGGCSVHGPNTYGWFGDTNNSTLAGTSGLRIRWTEQLTEELDSSYQPVEHAAAALDPRRDRIYVGSSGGDFYAFDSGGQRKFHYNPRSGIEAAPAIDPQWGDIYLASEDGVVHALRSRTGEVRWKESAPGPVRQSPVLTEDAVFAITESDEVVAFAREDGEILWTHRRDVDVELAIVGHSGLTLHEGVLYAGFTDGMVAALRVADGGVVWERPTQLDIEENNDAHTFYDADATPVVVDDIVYCASFAAGVYALDRSNGTVLWREPIKGVNGLTTAGRFLVLASADEGVITLDRNTRERLWGRPLTRGAPGQPVITGNGTVLVAESTGSLLALDLRSGRELSRIDSGHGFAAAPAVAGELGWILSNGGTLMAFHL